MGVNVNQTQFNSVEKTGGARTVDLSHTHTAPAHTHVTASHVLTISEVPAHTHSRVTMEIAGQFRSRPCVNSLNLIDCITTTNNAFVYTGDGSSNWGNSVNYTATSNPTDLIDFKASRSWSGVTSSVGGEGGHNHGNTGSAGNTATTSAGSSSQSVLQPYITCYMFKRVS